VSRLLSDLEPVTRALAEAFLHDCEAAGLRVIVTDTLRTMERQAELYAQGRTAPGRIVTKAKPGESPHNHGMAFDIAFAGRTPKELYPPASDPRWQQAGHIGRVLGLVWGGDWKGFVDRPHFERAGWHAAVAAREAVA
jgi:peptidoglycan L-alanyl-D-glutamate endopeptidase CwlK